MQRWKIDKIILFYYYIERKSFLSDNYYGMYITKGFIFISFSTSLMVLKEHLYLYSDYSFSML